MPVPALALLTMHLQSLVLAAGPRHIAALAGVCPFLGWPGLFQVQHSPHSQHRLQAGPIPWQGLTWGSENKPPSTTGTQGPSTWNGCFPRTHPHSCSSSRQPCRVTSSRMLLGARLGLSTPLSLPSPDLLPPQTCLQVTCLNPTLASAFTISNLPQFPPGSSQAP